MFRNHPCFSVFLMKSFLSMQVRNQIYTGSNHRKSLYDLSLPETFHNQIILFVHGYKGYKDWGAWHIMENIFLQNGYGFCKFNLSHNGGTVENPIDFPDLEAFSQNRYSYEKADVTTIIELIASQFPSASIILMGHSRGGGDVLLCGGHPKVKAIITLAAISSVAYRFRHTEIMEQWKNEGVRYELNTRTKQQMPIKYEQYLDFLTHQNELDIEKSCRSLNKPCLHFHGKDDDAILLSEGENIAKWTKQPLLILENCNHTFNTSHPWQSDKLSDVLNFVVEKCLSFLSVNNKAT